MIPVDATFQRMLPTARILWGALVVSTLLIAFMAFRLPQDPHLHLDPNVELILGVVAVGIAIASFVVPPLVATSNARRLDVGIFPANQLTGATARFLDPQRAARQALGIGQTTLILSMALSEVPSLLGLVLHMQGAPTPHVVPLFAAGTLLSLVRFPTVARMKSPFERAVGATFAASVEPGT
jgi:hypothetical protein